MAIPGYLVLISAETNIPSSISGLTVHLWLLPLLFLASLYMLTTGALVLLCCSPILSALSWSLFLLLLLLLLVTLHWSALWLLPASLVHSFACVSMCRVVRWYMTSGSGVGRSCIVGILGV